MACSVSGVVFDESLVGRTEEGLDALLGVKHKKSSGRVHRSRKITKGLAMQSTAWIGVHVRLEDTIRVRHEWCHPNAVA